MCIKIKHWFQAALGVALLIQVRWKVPFCLDLHCKSIFVSVQQVHSGLVTSAARANASHATTDAESSLDDVSAADTIDRMPIESVFNNQFSHLFGAQPLARHVDTIVGQFLGSSFNVSGLLGSGDADNLLNKLGGSVGEQNVKAIEDVLRNGQYQLDEATIETVSSILGQYDTGTLKTVGDIFEKLSRVSNIDPETLSVAENIVNGILSETDHIRGLEALKEHVTKSTEERKPRRHTDSESIGSGLGALAPHLNPKLNILLTKLRTDTESLMLVIETMYSSRLKRQPLSAQTSVQLSNFHTSIGDMAILSLALVNVTSPALSKAINNLCIATTHLIEMPITKLNLSKATKNLALALRQLLLGCQHKTVTIYERLDAKHLDPIVVINAMAAFAINLATILSICSHVLTSSVTLYASSCPTLPKVTATVEHVTNLVYISIEDFVDEATQSFSTVQKTLALNVTKAQRHAIRAMRYLLKAMQRIGNIFSF